MQKEISIDLKQYIYNLPNEKIAFEGSSNRENSKLLYYNKGKIEDKVFHQINDLIPRNSTLIFNNTKVIPARIHVQKKTGATIEIFLLKPAFNVEISQALESHEKAEWKCMIGNLKRWKEGEVLSKDLIVNNTPFEVKISLQNKEEKIVTFEWEDSNTSFAELIDLLGNTPLPPYIKRELEEADKSRYQTVYSKVDGAVAAPTAGLHFTDSILKKLKDEGVAQEHLTLHVGAGTFMPIKSNSVSEHPMHNEMMIIPIKTIASLLNSDYLIAVGTTSMRTLESLYWFGVKLIKNKEAEFKIDKLLPYQNYDSLPSKSEAIKAVLDYAKHNNLENVEGSTEIFIFPGYKFRVCQALITNFHQPESTLILLVAAFVGEKWETIYEHALQNDYRFLSFGDSSFIMP